MRVLTLAAQKGGAGKTTLAASLAVAAVQDGETVVVVDLDRQGSLREWHDRREARDILYRPIDAAGLDDLIAKIRAYGKISLVVIDTAGVFDTSVVAALRQSTLCLLPVRPSLLDVTATTRTAEELTKLGKRYAFVLNQVQAISAARAEDAAEALLKVGPIFPGAIGLRADHLDAMVVGKGVTEWRPKGNAATEVVELWAWTKKELESNR